MPRAGRLSERHASSVLVKHSFLADPFGLWEDHIPIRARDPGARDPIPW
jgi:hypothetical protein